MTREEFTLAGSTIVRHLMTVAAGALAAHGLIVGPQLADLGSSVAVLAAALAWSFVEKSGLMSRIVDGLPTSELEMLGKMLASFRGQGSNPLLIANIAQTALAVANAELINAHPELAPQPAPVAPAPEVAAPAPQPLSPPDVPAQAPVVAEGTTI